MSSITMQGGGEEGEGEEEDDDDGDSRNMQGTVRCGEIGAFA